MYGLEFGSVTTTKYHSSVLGMSVYFPYLIGLQGLPRWPQTAPQTAPGQQSKAYVKVTTSPFSLATARLD